MDIFKLVGSIYIDNDKANDSLSKTDKKASSVGSTLGSVGKAAGTMATAVVAGATAAVTGLTAMASSAAQSLDEVQKGAQQLGISYEAYQKLSYACDRSGLSIDNLSKGIKNITNVMAGMGTSDATAALETLGVATVDTEGKMKSSETVLEETLKSLASMEDVITRDALANDLFGNSYQDLAPLLNSGADGIEELMNRAEELGLVMSDDLVDAGAEFDDMMDDLKDSFGKIGVSLGSELMPIVKDAAEYLVEAMPAIREVFAQVGPVLADLFQTLLPPLMELAQAIFPVIMDLLNQLVPVFMQICEAILPVIVNLLNTLLPPIMKIIQTVLPPLIDVINALLPLFVTVIELLTPILELILNLISPILELALDAFVPLIEKIAELINDVLTPLIPVVEEVASTLLEVLQPVIEALAPVIEYLASIISEVLGNAFDFIGEHIQSIIGVFSGLIDFITGVFTGDWQKAFNGLSKIVSNIFNGMVNIVKLPINTIITGINAFIGGLNKIKIPDWVPGYGGKGINIPTIPKLAKGGTIAGEGLSIVGEAGAELIDMPQGARVTPLTQNQKDIFDNSDVLARMDAMMKVMQNMAADIAKNIGTIQAVIDGDEAFEYTRMKNREYKEMTGISAYM